jgi:hypothetical protein
MDQLDAFEFADVQSEPLRPRASIHKSGKLGFDSDSNEVMPLESGKKFTVAYGNGGPDETLLLLEPIESDPESSIMGVAKAGEYFYLNLRNFFDAQDVGYKKNRIRYDIEEADIEGRKGYVLTRRSAKPR